MGKGSEHFFKEDIPKNNRYRKKCSTSLMREMQSKTAVMYHLTPVRMVFIKKKTRDNQCWRGCGERDPLHTVGRNIDCYSSYGKQYGSSSKHFKN